LTTNFIYQRVEVFNKSEFAAECWFMQNLDYYSVCLGAICYRRSDKFWNPFSKVEGIILTEGRKVMGKLFLGICILFFSACATAEVELLPEGHPSDPGLTSPLIHPPTTLKDPEPVETAPARSEQWDDVHPEEHEQHPHELHEFPVQSEEALEHEDHEHHEHGH
jgi:hypothetical protein